VDEYGIADSSKVRRLAERVTETSYSTYAERATFYNPGALHLFRACSDLQREGKPRPKPKKAQHTGGAHACAQTRILAARRQTVSYICISLRSTPHRIPLLEASTPSLSASLPAGTLAAVQAIRQATVAIRHRGTLTMKLYTYANLILTELARGELLLRGSHITWGVDEMDIQISQ
jgi:hypothetical protein